MRVSALAEAPNTVILAIVCTCQTCQYAWSLRESLVNYSVIVTVLAHVRMQWMLCHVAMRRTQPKVMKELLHHFLFVVLKLHWQPSALVGSQVQKPKMNFFDVRTTLRHTAHHALHTNQAVLYLPIRFGNKATRHVIHATRDNSYYKEIVS